MSAAAAATSTRIFDADWAAKWREHLTDIIDPAWRPEEYDHAQLMFVPANKRAQLQCVRQGCGEIAVQKSLCTLCRREKWLSSFELDEFRRTPVSSDRSSISLTTCLVGCRRSTFPSGLCRQHNYLWRRYGNGLLTHAGVLEWIERIKPAALPPGTPCAVPGCWRDREFRVGLCHSHRSAGQAWIDQWNRQGRQPRADFDLWLARKAEPRHEPSGVALAKLGAVPFGLLEGSVGLELVAALQRRDAEGWLNFEPRELRHLYRDFRRCGVTTLVEAQGLESTDIRRRNCYYRSLATDLIDLVQAEHRKWSGIDDRDPLVIYFNDLDLTDHVQRGPPRSNRSARHLY